jgi:hypothetical protein
MSVLGTQGDDDDEVGVHLATSSELSSYRRKNMKRGMKSAKPFHAGLPLGEVVWEEGV